MGKINSFTDLTTWKKAHALVVCIYKVTEKFPIKEQYGLTNQIRRAAVSITSNIAEGFSRQSKKEKTQFYFTAKGSLTEVQNQLFIAKDVQYITIESFNNLTDNSLEVGRLLTGLIRSAQSK